MRGRGGRHHEAHQRDERTSTTHASERETDPGDDEPQPGRREVLRNTVELEGEPPIRTPRSEPPIPAADGPGDVCVPPRLARIRVRRGGVGEDAARDLVGGAGEEPEPDRFDRRRKRFGIGAQVSLRTECRLGRRPDGRLEMSVVAIRRAAQEPPHGTRDLRDLLRLWCAPSAARRSCGAAADSAFAARSRRKSLPMPPTRSAIPSNRLHSYLGKREAEVGLRLTFETRYGGKLSTSRWTIAVNCFEAGPPSGYDHG